MALTDENSTGIGAVMPVSPMGYGNGGMGGFGDWSSWIILFLIFGMFGGGWGMGGFGGFNGGGFGFDFPWLLNGQNGINANTNNGFAQAATQSAIAGLQNSVTAGFGDVQLGLAGVNQAICQTGNGITAAVTGAQNAISQQMYSNEIANLNRSFAEQTANMQGFNNIQSQFADCCCENRLANCQTQNIIQNEGNATRFADANNTRDIIDATNRGNQMILDKLCQLELDGVKAQVEAKNDRIAELQSQLNAANLAASQTAQNAFIAQGFANEVDQLYNRLNNCPVPTTPVYGRTPIFTCNQNQCGCGCGM